MYRKPDRQPCLDEFHFGFACSMDMDPNNRWIKLAKIIPWAKIEEQYAQLFAENNGQPAKPLRMALGSLIIKEKLNLSDEETVEHIKESPYLQYFIGLERFQTEAPFDPSLMVSFRKRLSLDMLSEISEQLRPGAAKAKCASAKKSEDDNKPPEGPSNPPSFGANADAKTTTTAGMDKPEPASRGKLILDATCAPADIRFPTDLSLLNEARENLEVILDELHAPLRGTQPKPRTYRKRARKDYLRIAKQKKPREAIIRRAIRKQLGYVNRNLLQIDRLLDRPNHGELPASKTKRLETIRKLIAQQWQMYTGKTHSVQDRIVSLSQPQVRPIIRGKANAYCEFGAKLAVSVVAGYAAVEKLEWNAFNESGTLVKCIEAYRRRYGHYPEAVLADKIYRNRENLAYCKEKGIRFSGPRLGRPSKNEDKQSQKVERQDNRERNAIEGKFGEGKRRYGLGRIMAKLQETAESVIGVQFLVMNLQRLLRILLRQFGQRLLMRLRWSFLTTELAMV